MIFERIQQILKQYPIVLFMKGSPERPFCGFSRRVCAVLQVLGVDFHAVDVLMDPEMREGLKEFSDWPTFPQLYVKEQLVGGCDIVEEMYESQELQDFLKSANLL